MRCHTDRSEPVSGVECIPRFTGRLSGTLPRTRASNARPYMGCVDSPVGTDALGGPHYRTKKALSYRPERACERSGVYPPVCRQTLGDFASHTGEQCSPLLGLQWFPRRDRRPRRSALPHMDTVHFHVHRQSSHLGGSGASGTTLPTNPPFMYFGHRHSPCGGVVGYV